MSLSPRSLQEGLLRAGSKALPEASLLPLSRYLEKLMEINRGMNLTKWNSPQEILIHHVLDSAAALPLLQGRLQPSRRWLDLGTGGGFPGVVLLAAEPGVFWHFLDSTAKKTKAVETCLKAAGWSAGVLAERAETLGQDPDHRETYHGVVARALADFPVVLEYALPLLAVGGCFIHWATAQQTHRVEGAQRALETLGGKVVEGVDYSLPGVDQKRRLWLVEKVGKTPTRYPRAPGKPAKNPL